jgi:hypothetical protein
VVGPLKDGIVIGDEAMSKVLNNYWYFVSVLTDKGEGQVPEEDNMGL